MTSRRSIGPSIVTAPVIGAGGVRLHIHSSGPADGIPVLLLHGQASSGRVWQRLMSGPLAQTARLIAPDYRGHGRSDKPSRGYHNSRTWAQDLTAVVNHFQLQEPILVGWSYGTAVACDYLRHGGHARAFALISGGTEANLLDRQIRATLHPDLLKLIRRHARPRRTRRDQFAEQLVSLFTATRQPAELHTMLVQDALSVAPAAAIGIATRSYQNDDILTSLQIPILQIHGTHDRVRLPSAAERRTPLFRTGRTEIWPGSGHAPFLDEPGRFNTALLTLLTTNHGTRLRRA